MAVSKVALNGTTLIDISDTTATADKILTGFGAYGANGVWMSGTASGGAGASNIAQGTFTTGSTRGGTGSVTTSYTGTGYPIALMVYVDGGAYNNTSGGNTTWYNSTNRYDCGWYAMAKSQMNTTPSYSNSAYNDCGVVAIIYKNSTSNATTYTRTSSMSNYSYSNSNATGGVSCVRFKGNGKTISYYVGNSGSGTVGLAPSTKYAYIAIYSS